MKKIPRTRRSTFFQFLKANLENQLPAEYLPRRLRMLGHVAILWLHPEIVEYKELIGQVVLEYQPKIRSVLRRTAAISGPYRQPAVELIAGSSDTETAFTENRVVFHLDPMKVMFSVGNKAERLRMSQLGTNEVIVDMFAGIGQLSLPIAVHAQPTRIHGIEWNPDAYHYLKQNITANKVDDLYIPYFGDTGNWAPKIGQGKADRVIMGLIQGTMDYLKSGILSLRPGGIMHLHEIGPRTNLISDALESLEAVAQTLNRKVNLVNSRTIKTYNPQYNHFVLDIQILGA